MRASILGLLILFALSGASASENPQPEDFLYLGAFALGPADEGSHAHTYGQRGLAMDPVDGGLWITGHDHLGQVYKTEIPELVNSKKLEDLHTASYIEPPRDFISHCPLDHSWHFSGIEILDGQLNGVCKYWYNAEGYHHETFYRKSMESGTVEGPFRIGRQEASLHSSKVGAYLFSIPEDWVQAHGLNKKRLITGYSKEAGCCGGSQGPTLIAFDPDNPEDALDLVWYRERHPGCPPDGCDYPQYSSCDSWEGATWVRLSTGDAVLVAGSKGIGPTRYGPSQIGDCNPYQGYHCDPFEPQILFYSSSDLASRAAGNLKPWEVLPYAVWKPKEFWSDSCGSTAGPGGMAYDPSTGHLYVVDMVVGPFGESIVHVYQGSRPAQAAP